MASAVQAPRGEVTMDEVQAYLNELRTELNAISQRVAELEADRNEHNTVLETLGTMDGKRKCYRLVGDTLVERTVDEVKPGVTTTRDGIDTLIKQLTGQFKAKETEFNDIQNKLRAATSAAVTQQTQPQSRSTSK